jgi:hypothetical protein
MSFFGKKSDTPELPAELRRLVESASSRLAACEKIEAARKDAEAELPRIEKEHNAILERWQASCALSGSDDSPEPRQVSALATKQRNFAARIQGLRQELIREYEKLAPLVEEIHVAMRPWTAALVADHQQRLAAAKSVVEECVRVGMALERFCGGGSVVGAHDRWTDDRSREVEAAELPAELLQPARVLEALQRRLGKLGTLKHPARPIPAAERAAWAALGKANQLDPNNRPQPTVRIPQGGAVDFEVRPHYVDRA